MKFIFFGTSTFSSKVLETLKEQDVVPSLIVATPDEPSGRGLAVKSVPTKVWAAIHNIPVFQPETLKEVRVEERLREESADLFLIASYGKIIPKNIFEIPPHGSLNIHPSLLPKLRGAAPIQETILKEKEAGVTLMLINEKMDEGPILSQERVLVPEWPPRYTHLEDLLAKVGGELFLETIPRWLTGDIKPQAQNQAEATYTRKIEKVHSDITNNSPETALRKIRAYEVWPRARLGDLIIKEAHLENGELVVDRVIPPGKREMDYKDYLRGKNI